MSLILEGLQFCKELSTTEGDMTPGSPAPNLTLLGPPDGFESIISKIGNGHSGFFFLRHGFAWMRFRGTVTNPDQLSVDQVLNSSDSGNPLVLGPGTKQVYCSMDEYSSGSLMLLASAQAAGHAVIDFTNSIDARFDQYEIHFDGVRPGTDNVDLWLRGSQDNGSSFLISAIYYFSRHGSGSAGGAVASGAGSGDSKIVLIGNVDNQSGSGITGRLHFSRIHNYCTWDLVYLNNDGAIHLRNGGGAIVTGSVNALRLLMSSGVIASGSMKFYGVRK